MRIHNLLLLATILVFETPGFAQQPAGIPPQPAGIPQQPAPQEMNVPPPLPGQPGVSTGEPSIFAGFMDSFDYDPRGRRDPFAQPIADKPAEPGAMHGPLLPLQKFDVNQLRLVGIIWDVRHPKAMIRDPQGKTHIVGPNTKIGPRNGYIAVIREGEMVVVETVEQDGKLASTAQVVKIAR